MGHMDLRADTITTWISFERKVFLGGVEEAFEGIFFC
jgi:hypothetical protein